MSPPLQGLERKLFFHSLQVEDGLTQNMVYAILQDHNGYLWFGTQDGLNRFDGYRIKNYRRNSEDKYSLGNNCIFSLKEDLNGILWIGTMDGIFLYDEKKDSFSRLSIKDQYNSQIRGLIRDIEFDKNNIWIAGTNKLYNIYEDCCHSYSYVDQRENIQTHKNVSFRDLVCDSLGNVWIATYEGGLIQFKNGNFHLYSCQHFVNEVNEPDLNTLLFIYPDTLLVGSVKNGVFAINLKNNQISSFFYSSSKKGDHYIRALSRSKDGSILIGTENGLFLKNNLMKDPIHLIHINGDPYSLSNNAIHSLYTDKWGGIWVGTFFGGVNYTYETYEIFQKFYPVNGINTISGKSISEFCVSKNNGLWIGTEDNGLNFYNNKTKQFTLAPIPARNIHALLEQKDTLWVGTFSQGLYRWIRSKNDIRHWETSSVFNSIPDNSIYSLFKDSKGLLWLGMTNGLYIYDEVKDKFLSMLSEDLDCQVNDIIEDRDGILWIATWGKGVYSFNRKSQQWRNYKNCGPFDFEESRLITSLLLDSKGIVWAATAGAGFTYFNRIDGRFSKFYTTKNGLPNNVVYTLQEDSLHSIWGSTNKGIFSFEPEKEEIQVYTNKNGLLGGQFNSKSGICTSDGTVYLGGIKGFVSFDPRSLKSSNLQPQVLVTDLKICKKNGWQSYSDEDGMSLIYHTILKLPYFESTFSVEYSALDFMNLNSTLYAYRLEGKSDDWIYTDTPYPVIYTDLSPGKYKFMVKASNNGKDWSVKPAVISIVVIPPWYSNKWAYIAYLFTILLIIGIILRSFKIKNYKKNKEFQNQLEYTKERELYRAKIDFFTNITHEIRTPLSLIYAPLEEVLKNTDDKDPDWINLNIIHKNTHSLLSLVNELLDFRKIENSKIGLNIQNIDFNQLMCDIISQFKPSLDKKGIKLDYQCLKSPLYIDADQIILAKVISNLLSNAWKHAQSLIQITLQIKDNQISVLFKNDGPSIPIHHIDKIFHPYFKCDETTPGTGLGLPFARMMAEAHGGSLNFFKDPFLVAFILTLPLHHENAIKSNYNQLENSLQIMYHNHMPYDEIHIIDQIKPDILLVEDNDDFRTFLGHTLSTKFKVYSATNGKEGLDLLEKVAPRIIISDLMMPIMDGLTLCNKVKSQLRFSHIPVIILTAKTTIQSRIEGLSNGADAYIEKPFSIDHLFAQIYNIFENRSRLIESFKTDPNIGLNALNLTSVDNEFMSTLIKAIQDHMSAMDLDVDKLASILNVSRATLYRKFKLVTDQSPNEFIQLIRLKRAAQLLMEGKYRINEICFIVGFNSASYFSKCFYKQFGVLPSNYDVQKQSN